MAMYVPISPPKIPAAMLGAARSNIEAMLIGVKNSNTVKKITKIMTPIIFATMARFNSLFTSITLVCEYLLDFCFENSCKLEGKFQ